jgi:hypothetical protein
MARTKLTTDNTVTDAANFQTAIVQPSANTLVLMFVTNTRPFVNQAPAIPTITGNGLTWQQVQTVTTGPSQDRRLTCFLPLARAPAPGPITIDFGGETQDFCAWSVFEYDGVDTGGSAGEAAIAQSATGTGNGAALTVDLGPSADPTRNLSVGAIILDLLADPVRPVDAGFGFTQIDEQIPNQLLGKGATLQTEDSPVFTPAVAWTWAGVVNSAAIVLEVKAAPLAQPTPPGPAPADPIEHLIRRFEPVLFFHPQEMFFPVDAKRYVENAALWASRPPFDNKNGWGGMPGDPFPRQPLEPAGKLAALPGEPGDYLGGTPLFLLDGLRDERFFELGGWKDQAQTHEPGVTDTSANIYSDRTAILKRYQNEPALSGSQFWYHAEFYDTNRLTDLAKSITAPDLHMLLTKLPKPAMLLCYYLFFPAHDQGVTKDACPNIEAREAACHAGDWQCIAIMLEDDGSGNLDTATPKFFGHTGSRPARVLIDGNFVFRPHQFDDEGLTVMKVEEWRPPSGPTANQPEAAGEHPRLYVAQGSHSLYTTPGSHEVDPFPQGNSFSCGLYDTSNLLPGDDGDSLLGDAGAFFAKLAGGGILNIGSHGWIAGVIAAALEGVLPHSVGLNLQGADVPNPDEAPAAAGDGKTVRPAGLTLSDGGADVQDWVSQQGLELNGRRYDFVVDRATQIWWPDEKTPAGFRGRWGQHVTSDSLPRRSGPKFPPYWKMFLLALADGDTRKLIDLAT